MITAGSRFRGCHLARAHLARRLRGDVAAAPRNPAAEVCQRLLPSDLESMVLACDPSTAERPQRTFPRRLRRALDGAVVRHLDGRPDPWFRLAALGGSRRRWHDVSIELGQPPL